MQNDPGNEAISRRPSGPPEIIKGETDIIGEVDRKFASENDQAQLSFLVMARRELIKQEEDRKDREAQRELQVRSAWLSPVLQLCSLAAGTYIAASVNPIAGLILVGFSLSTAVGLGRDYINGGIKIWGKKGSGQDGANGSEDDTDGGV